MTDRTHMAVIVPRMVTTETAPAEGPLTMREVVVLLVTVVAVVVAAVALVLSTSAVVS